MLAKILILICFVTALAVNTYVYILKNSFFLRGIKTWILCSTKNVCICNLFEVTSYVKTSAKSHYFNSDITEK